MRNIFSGFPESLPEELFETLAVSNNLRIERIISYGHNTPPGEWYDQAWHEWVIVLEGKATVIYEQGQIFNLVRGDYLFIPAHTRHRVTWTIPNDYTVWLAVHFASV